jgi:hypothetical protein
MLKMKLIVEKEFTASDETDPLSPYFNFHQFFYRNAFKGPIMAA